MLDFVDRLAIRANQTRFQVLNARRVARNMRMADIDEGRSWITEDGHNARLTVTMSLGEAVALVRVIGPLEDFRSDSQIRLGGSVARFLAATHVVRQAVLRQPDGGMAVGVALSVLRLALDELERQYASKPSKKSARHR